MTMSSVIRISEVRETQTQLEVLYKHETGPSGAITSLSIAYASTTFAAKMIPLAGIVSGIMAQNQLQDMMQALRRDIHNMIQEAVAELKRHIDMALERDVIEECQARVNTAWDSLRAWNNATKKTDVTFRLNDAEDAARFVVNRLEPKGRQALLAYVDAVSVLLTVLAIRAKEFNDPGELRTALEMYERAYPHISPLLDEVISFWDQKIEGVTPLRISIYGGPTDAIPNQSFSAVAYYDENGEKKRIHVRGPTLSKNDSDYAAQRDRANAALADEARKQGEAHRQHIIESYDLRRQEATEQVVVPVLTAMYRWRQGLGV